MSYIAPSTDVAIQTKQWLKPHFTNQDFAASLTFNPVADECWPDESPDFLSLNSHIREYLHKVNYKFLGRNFKRGYRLKSANTFEFRNSKAVLCHLIIGKPTSIELRKDYESFLPTLEECWLRMDCSGPKGTHSFEFIHDLDAWIDYIFKDFTAMSAENADILNWNLTGFKH